MTAALLVAGLALLGPVPQPATASPRPSPCPYEENCACAVPGITLRWKAAHCMYREETDDLEHDGVRRCLERPDPRRLSGRSACERNAYWKTMLCRSKHGRPADARKCAADPAFVPRFVEHGPGS